LGFKKKKILFNPKLPKLSSQICPLVNFGVWVFWFVLNICQHSEKPAFQGECFGK
jgi:hypothetical protein